MRQSSFQVGGRQALPSSSLQGVPKAVALTWNYRLRVELEAADQFVRLAKGIHQIGGPPELVRLALKAAKDEGRHATLCQKIVSSTGIEVSPLIPQLGIPLGPRHLSVRDQVLYGVTALSSITETLSAALLVEMQKGAKPPVIRQTVHSILEDEILHSRIGWALLASESQKGDLSWLGKYVPEMLREAMNGEVDSHDVHQEHINLSKYGILPRTTARAFMAQATENVILPGLRKFGIV